MSDESTAGKGKSPDAGLLGTLGELIYRDIALADAKAGFALTISTLGVAGTASFYGSMPDPERRLLALTDMFVLIFTVSGVFCAFIAILYASLAVLPRRYVRGPGDVGGGARGQDFLRTVGCNLPFRALEKDEASDRFEGLSKSIIASTPDLLVAEWSSEVIRQAAVRRRKYWWVGPSIVLATAGIIFMLIGLGRAILVINRDVPRGVPARGVQK